MLHKGFVGFLAKWIDWKKEQDQEMAGNSHYTVVLRAKSFIALDLQRAEISASLSGETRTNGPAVRRLPSHSVYRHTRFPPLSYSIHPLCPTEAGDRLEEQTQTKHGPESWAVAQNSVSPNSLEKPSWDMLDFPLNKSVIVQNSHVWYYYLLTSYPSYLSSGWLLIRHLELNWE